MMPGPQAHALRAEICDAAPEIKNGSPKQNKWAWEIRANCVLILCMGIGDKMHFSQEVVTEEQVRQIANVADARWWIDNRFSTDDPTTLLRNLPR